jgi:hypothetical protein
MSCAGFLGPFTEQMNTILDPLCQASHNGLSMGDLCALTLTGYELNLGNLTFKAEMQHFFGPLWREVWDEPLVHVVQELPVLVYRHRETRMNVVALRSFS